MADTNENSEAKPQWKQTSGFADDSTVVQLVVPESKAASWNTEADEHGFKNRSAYLRTLIGEARAYRQHDVGDPHTAEQQIDALQEEVEQLEQRLEQERQAGAASATIDDPAFVKRFLSDTYTAFPDLLQQVMESGVLDDVVRKPVEDQLYFLAAQDVVEYERGWGWKLADDDVDGGAP